MAENRIDTDIAISGSAGGWAPHETGCGACFIGTANRTD
jgi:hypothetical protein